MQPFHERKYNLLTYNKLWCRLFNRYRTIMTFSRSKNIFNLKLVAEEIWASQKFYFFSLLIIVSANVTKIESNFCFQLQSLRQDKNLTSDFKFLYRQQLLPLRKSLVKRMYLLEMTLQEIWMPMFVLAPLLPYVLHMDTQGSRERGMGLVCE